MKPRAPSTGRRIRRSALTLGASLLLIATPWRAALAVQAGDNIASLGWLHFKTMDNGSTQVTQVNPAIGNSQTGMAAGIPTTPFNSPGTGLMVSGADTVGLVFTHFFTDHIAVQLVGGIPPEFKLNARGKVVTPLNALGQSIAGDSGTVDIGNPAYQPLVKSVREWAPAMIFNYFFNPHGRISPFLGVGVSYVWFTHVQFDAGFKQNSQNTTGALLSKVYNNPTLVQFLTNANPANPVRAVGHASSSFVPVFNAGVSIELTDRIYTTASLSFAPLRSNASLTYLDAKTNTALAQSVSRLGLNTLVTALTIGYRFRLFDGDGDDGAHAEPSVGRRPVHVVPLHGG
jgi:Outer membrane protein W